MEKLCRSKLLLALIISLTGFLQGQVGYAQQEGDCAVISPGPDAGGLKTCDDQVILSATPGLENYRWGKYIPGGEEIIESGADQLVVNRSGQGSGTYWWETMGTVHPENLIENGDFESGNTGVLSDYDYLMDEADRTNELYPEGSYSITTSPHAVHGGFCEGGDYTTGTGNMMVINGAEVMDQKVWYQEISVSPNTNYVFSVYFTSVNSLNPGELRFSIAGEQLGAAINLDEQGCTWEEFYTVWNSGTYEGVIEISIVNQNIIADGNDFAIDNILFSKVCTHREDIEVTFLSQPEVTIAPLGSTIFYPGDEVDLEITDYNENYTYQWLYDEEEIEGETGKIHTTTREGNYSVSVTNEWECTASAETVNLRTTAVPEITVTEGAVTSEICQNEGSISFDVTNTFETDYYRVVDPQGTVIGEWAEIDGNTIWIDNLGGGEYILEIYDRYRSVEDPFQHAFVIADERQIIITPIVRNIQCYGDEAAWIRFEVETIGCGSNNIRVRYKHQEEEVFTDEKTIGLGGGKSEYIQYYDGTINFPVGVYDFRVRQGGGNCTDCGILEYQITVEGPPSELVADAVVTQDFLCSGDIYYEATVFPEGGWAGYSYLWSDGQSTQTASFLSPGATYTVKVTDAGGCTVERMVEIPGENAGTMNISPTLTDPVCSENNGAITIDYSGIDPTQYDVTWRKDDPEEGEEVAGDHNGIHNLSAGTYFLLLSNGEDTHCKIIREYTLIEEGTPVTILQDDQRICEGESVVFAPTISSPIDNYTFNWYFDINKIDPVIDNSDLGPQEVVYEIDPSGILTISGLPHLETPHSYYVEVTGDGVCTTTAGELKQVKVTVADQPASPQVNVLGGHPRNIY